MKKTFTLICFSWFSNLMLFGAIPFWEVHFETGLPNGWSVEDASGNEVFWNHCDNFSECLTGQGPINGFFSTSAEDGFMLLNSGAAGPLPGAGHVSRMRSSSVDCSAHERVFVQFQTSIATDNEAAFQKAILRVITPQGASTFRPFPTLKRNEQQLAPNPNIAPGRPYVVTFDITNLAAGQPSVELEWEWAANYEFAWMIDDVILTENHPAEPDHAVFFEPFEFGDNGWTSNVLFFSESDSTWQWRAGGDASRGLGADRSALGPDFFIHSQTAVDGAMLFDADYYTTLGEEPAQQFHLCELISPVIDLSTAEKPLALSFHQLAWLGNTAFSAPSSPEGTRFITSFAYSTNGGSSWSLPQGVNPYLTPVTSANGDQLPPYDNREYFPLPDLEGVTEFRIKFTWAGDFYFWVLDDIALEERPDSDLRTNPNFFARSPNLKTPASQLLDIPLQSDLQNIGSQNATVVTRSFHLEAAGGSTPLFSVTEPVAEVLEVNALYENTPFGNLLETTSLPGTGTYTGTYTAGHEEPDQRPENDAVSWSFEVTDSTFAKEAGFTRDIAPVEEVDYTYGNCFFVPNGDGLYARYVTFAVSNPLPLANSSRAVNVILHEWAGDLNENDIADAEELEEIAINLYPFNGTEGLGEITLPVSFEGAGVPLKDSTYYLISVRYNDPTPPLLFMLASDTIDYTATVAAHNSTPGLVPQYASVLDIGNDGAFSLLGFGYDIVPLVRLHIGNSPILTSAQEESPETPAMTVSPNPADAYFQVSIEGEWAAKDARLSLIDARGKTVLIREIENSGNKNFTFAAHKLPSGWYSLKLETAATTFTKPLVVQH
ncbi:MAG: T9SS type A sorting domain-containing protein [Phaeodactylibacter sp.]|uniref:T9SS type A sorting domain-containing protein n=1 Tax=Phaeodactylibacter sp. TaxID=1940289 RepID=UPI0032EE66FA